MQRHRGGLPQTPGHPVRHCARICPAALAEGRHSSSVWCSHLVHPASNITTARDESAAGLPKASASVTPKAKRKRFTLQRPESVPEYPRRLKVSDSPVIFRSKDTKAETELKAAEKQVGSHTQLRPQAI